MTRFAQIIRKRTNCEPERAVIIADGLLKDLRAANLDIVHIDWVTPEEKPQGQPRSQDFWDSVSEMAESMEGDEYKPWRPM